MRLDKFLVDCGVGSRSQVKTFLKKKQVTVNGQVETSPKAQIDENKDRIAYLGQELTHETFVYYLLNKPQGVISATEDARHKTVLDLLDDTARHKQVFPVGRLDIDTHGLLLLTNNGDLAHAMLSPKKHVDKTYYARIDGKVDEEDQRAFLQGVDIGDETKTAPAKLEILKSADISEILLTIQEGRFHQVKRMFQARDKQVIYLKRMTMGPLVLGDDLPKGNYRELCEEERKALERV